MQKCSLYPATQLKAQTDLVTATVNTIFELALQDCSAALPGKCRLVIFPSAVIKVCTNTLTELKHMHGCVGIVGAKTLEFCSLWFISEGLRYTERALKKSAMQTWTQIWQPGNKDTQTHPSFPRLQIVGSEKIHHRQCPVASACPAKTETSNCCFVTVFLKHPTDRLLPNLLWTKYNSC